MPRMADLSASDTSFSCKGAGRMGQAWTGARGRGWTGSKIVGVLCRLLPRVAHDAGVAALRVGFCRAHVRQRHGRSRGRGFVGPLFCAFHGRSSFKRFSLQFSRALCAYAAKSTKSAGLAKQPKRRRFACAKEALPGFGAWPALPHGEMCAPNARTALCGAVETRPRDLLRREIRPSRVGTLRRHARFFAPAMRGAASWTPCPSGGEEPVC